MTPEERHIIEFCLDAPNLLPYDRKFLLDLLKRKAPLTYKQEFYLKQIYLQHSNRIEGA